MTKPDTARDKNPKINMDYRAEEKPLGQYKKKGYVQMGQSGSRLVATG